MTAGWNHSIHYYDVLLAAVPPGAREALDVGTGRGGFARLLASRVERVDAIDRDRASIAAARERSANVANICFIEADVMAHELPVASYDFVTAIATLHHLPFAPAIAKLAALLRPSGVLAILGLYRTQTAVEWLASFVAFPVSRANRLIRGRADVDAPLREPEMTLDEIRRGVADLLPGATIRATPAVALFADLDEATALIDHPPQRFALLRAPAKPGVAIARMRPNTAAGAR